MALGHSDQVGFHRVNRRAEPGAAAAEGRDHLVRNQWYDIFLKYRLDFFPVTLWRENNPAGSEDRLCAKGTNGIRTSRLRNFTLLSVDLERDRRDIVQGFKSAIAEIPGILQAFDTMDDTGFVLLVVSGSLADYETVYTVIILGIATHQELQDHGSDREC